MLPLAACGGSGIGVVDLQSCSGCQKKVGTSTSHNICSVNPTSSEFGLPWNEKATPGASPGAKPSASACLLMLCTLCADAPVLVDSILPVCFLTCISKQNHEISPNSTQMHRPRSRQTQHKSCFAGVVGLLRSKMVQRAEPLAAVIGAACANKVATGWS